MKRREILKNISLGMGATISTPALISLITSCQTVADTASSTTAAVETAFSPSYLNKNQYTVVRLFVDKLLPKTSSPGALEVKVPEVIDGLLNTIFEPKQQNDFQQAWKGFAATVQNDQNINLEETEAKPEQIDAFFDKYMAPKDEVTLKRAQKLTETPLKEISEADKPLANTYKFIRSLSDMSINTFFRTEEIATNHLNFDPIPGIYNGCIPLEEVGNKTWAL